MHSAPTMPSDVALLLDVELLEESALAIAQARIQVAMDDAKISRSEMARRMGCHRAYITRMMTGEHNLTIKTLARALAACERRVVIDSVAIEREWATLPDFEPLVTTLGAPAFAGAPKQFLDYQSLRTLQ